MDRRTFLAGSATAALLPAVELPAVAQSSGSGDAQINALFEELFQERVRTSPQLATQLGLDKGPLAALKAKLDTDPVAKQRSDNLARTRRGIARLQVISPSTLSDSARL